MRVVLFGLRGVGVEAAKNLALQGAGAITLVDSVPASVVDIGVNFFISGADLGKPRAQVVRPKLQELNPICSVNVAEKLTEELIKTHTALVVTQYLPLSELVRLNEFCRQWKVSFLYAFTGGISADVFVDHGPDHIVTDFDGERPIQKLITDVTRISADEVLIRYETPEGQQHSQLTEGHFEVTEVQGFYGINMATYAISHPEKDPVKTLRVPYAALSVNDERYTGGGLLTQKKVPTKYPMESLAFKLKDPGNAFAEPPTLVLTDLINFGSELQQHVAFYATQAYAERNGNAFPRPNNEDDAKAVLQVAKELLANGSIALDSFDLNEDAVLRYARHAAVELQGMVAFVGGVLAQEVVKCTGKFTPIPGFFHFSAPEALPNADSAPTDTAPRGHPNDELAAIYGWKFVEQLGNLKYFMVGCGALGCEFIKNFALNGICCGPEGKLVVTDADRIELSNLSRQFLFREHNVGQSKSRAAAVMGVAMNSKFQMEALEQLVCAKSENVFNDDFWTGLDGVCNAVDNMEARMYVDSQCVKYEKSLLESGTMGTGGNIDTICPFKTRTYRDGGNAAEGGGVPMCTLRNFPHLTDHCIEWARDQFELLFSKLGKTCEAYLKDPTDFEAKIRNKAQSEPGAAFFDIRSVSSMMRLVAEPSIGRAAQLAFDIFHFLFRDRILDLQAAFPQDFRIIDEKTKADKGPFWGEKKRYPTVVMYNPKDENHRSFLLAATCLFSVIVGVLPQKRAEDAAWLQEYRDPDWIVGIVSMLSVPPYLQAPVNSEGIDNAPAMDKNALNAIVDGLFNDLRAAATSVKSLPSFEPADFEKDDDQNFHIAFVTAASNLRCDNYFIKRTDFHACKVIAGKIIAAIATTTAAVCGLVMLELFKLVLKKDTESFMNRQIGLARYTYTSFTQEEPRKFKTTEEMVAPPDDELPEDAWDEKGKLKPEFLVKRVHRSFPEGHTCWDKLTVQGSLTLKEFSQWLAAEHGVKLVSWDFIYGQKTHFDEETKTKNQVGVSTPVFPPKPVLDYSLLPSLELTVAQATTAIMKTAAAKPTQQYVGLWRELKASGAAAIPPQPVLSADVITENTTLTQILHRMAALAADAMESGAIETRSIPELSGRKFIVIPGGEAPVCTHIESGDDIENFVAIKIML